MSQTIVFTHPLQPTTDEPAGTVDVANLYCDICKFQARIRVAANIINQIDPETKNLAKIICIELDTLREKLDETIQMMWIRSNQVPVLNE